jgi:hypothetical protein
MNNERQDVYTRISDKIVADLEQGVRTWMKPWIAGRLTASDRIGAKVFFSLGGDKLGPPLLCEDHGEPLERHSGLV